MGCSCCKKKQKAIELKDNILSSKDKDLWSIYYYNYIIKKIKFTQFLESKIAENLLKINSREINAKIRSDHDTPNKKITSICNTTNKSPGLETEKKFNFNKQQEDSFVEVSLKNNKLGDDFSSNNKSLIKAELNDGYFNQEELNYYAQRLFNQEKRQRSYEINFNTFIKKGELIGEGGFGKVYTGFDELEGRVIAVKEIIIGSCESESYKSVRDLI